MTWTCEQTELRLSDYLDGLLNEAEQHAFDTHVSACERCTPLVSSVSHLLTNLHGMQELETPPRLVYSILDKTLGPRDSVTGWRALLGWVRAIASPRFAYGAVSVAATLMVLLTASGFSWRKPKIADLSPVNVYRNADRQAHLVYARGSKFVSDLRVVYEIQSRLHQDNEIPTTPEGTLPESSPDKQPGRTDGTRPASPRQQNRANGIGHEVELLAEGLPALIGRRMP
ncbi:MAG TPA: zf-HC2 domain-containing protein [Candidatus Acidoferrum sp.]|nr:zf-HC2 domain-containing protein [Candidatus Acidoferrum sp.]